MKVYAVIGGWDYEGQDFDSMQLFDCHSTAESYYKELTEGFHDYALIQVREVNMQSMIAA
jgi:hypothetical protein